MKINVIETTTSSSSQSLSHTTCGTIRQELQKMWDEIGESVTERDKMLLELEHECLDIYERKLEDTRKHKDGLCQALAEGKSEIPRLTAALGEKTSSSLAHGTLKEQLSSVKLNLGDLRPKEQRRVEDFSATESQITRISVQMAGNDQPINNAESQVNEDDLTTMRLSERKSHLEVLQKLQEIWDDIGKSDNEKEKMLLELEQECLDIYQRKVEYTRKHKADLYKALVEGESEIARLSAALGERTSFSRAKGTLKEQLSSVKLALDDLRLKKHQRVQDFSETELQITLICAEIEGNDQVIDHAEPQLNEDDLTTSRLSKCKSHLKELQNEKVLRLEKVNNHLSSIRELSEVMSLDFITIVAEIHSSLVDTGHGQSKSISNDTLGKLTAGVNSLKQDKQQRLQKIQELGSALNELWNLLETSVFDRNKFEHVTCYIRSSVDEVSWPGSLSQDVIKQAETEVARLNILKGSKMELVSKKQTELEEVFKEAQRETLISSDSGCAAREHSPQYPEKFTAYRNKRGREIHVTVSHTGPKLVSVYVKEAAGQQKSGEVDINHCYGYSTFALDIQNLCEELPDERPTPHVCSPWFPVRGLAEYYAYTKQGVEIINPLNEDWGEFSARVDYVIILPLDTNLDVNNIQLLDSVDEVRETMPIFKTLIENPEQLARVIYFYSCSHAGIEPGPIPKEDSRTMSDDELLVWGFAECSYYDHQDVKMEVKLVQDYLWAWRMSDDEFLRRLARICIRDMILE